MIGHYIEYYISFTRQICKENQNWAIDVMCGLFWDLKQQIENIQYVDIFIIMD